MKKCVLLEDAFYLNDFIDKFFYQMSHRYFYVIVRQENVSFVETINMSRRKLTMSDLKQDTELFKDLFQI